MIGIDIAGDAWPVLEAALQRGLLLLSAGQKTLRLLPPYIITEEEIDEGLKTLKSILDTIPLGA
jgi:acetylornithine/succinyldiaminopimelate/putrescine aminotransferase